MNLVDSSGWLEYLANESNADFFAPAIEKVPELVVPSVSIYEVFKRVIQQRGEDDALQTVALMMQGRVVSLGTIIALSAARLSLQLRLPMADSIILATARRYNATLWTQDVDFRSIPGVRYIEKQ